jgi:hypothetical protein
VAVDFLPLFVILIIDTVVTLSVDLDFYVMVLRLPSSWHRKDPIFFAKLLPPFFLAYSGIVYRGGPPGRCRQKNSGGRY